MSLDPEYIADLFASFGPVRVRKMFGAAGLYAGEVFFGIVSDSRIYLKVDDLTRPDYEAEGKSHFTFELKSGDIGAMSYYELPDRLYDDPDELAAWARKSVAAALRAKTKKRRSSQAESRMNKTPVKKVTKRNSPRRPRKRRML